MEKAPVQALVENFKSTDKRVQELESERILNLSQRIKNKKEEINKIELEKQIKEEELKFLIAERHETENYCEWEKCKQEVESFERDIAVLADKLKN